MLLYNIACISVAITAKQFTKYSTTDVQKAIFWQVLVAVSVVAKDVGNGVGHWIFGFKYFKIQDVMKFFINNQDVPDHLRKKHDQLNFAFIAINIIAPLVEGTFYLLANAAYVTKHPLFPTFTWI